MMGLAGFEKSTARPRRPESAPAVPMGNPAPPGLTFVHCPGVPWKNSKRPPPTFVRPSATKIVLPSGLTANWFGVGKPFGVLMVGKPRYTLPVWPPLVGKPAPIDAG